MNKRILPVMVLILLMLAGCTGNDAAAPSATAAESTAAEESEAVTATEASAAEEAEREASVADAAGAASGAVDDASSQPDSGTLKMNMDTIGTDTASAIRICIDPGHYTGYNRMNGDESERYAEGDFMLRVGKELGRILKKQYGFKVCLTRNSSDISINGYRNLELDSHHIELRGEYAAEKECDFIVSLHTNANEDGANDCPTWQQPTSITKTIILANELCYSNKRWLTAANEIGKRLSQVNYKLGIADNDEFLPASTDDITEWTKEYNDSLNKPGTVQYRNGKHGDYYGVLNGATQTGIPGIIIEHGYHTVQVMRKAAIDGSLDKAWAEADAEGIVAALGIH